MGRVIGRGRWASARFGRVARDAVADLFDQRTGFGRLALTHVVLTSGDALLTVSLAGSLFFSISPQAAKGKVLLYLLLTMAPFFVVAPLLGPVIDRSRGARRATVVASSAARAVVCLVMAGDLKSLLLFPEAFVMLVLSKVYLVTKGSLVPQLADIGPAGGTMAPPGTDQAQGGPGGQGAMARGTASRTEHHVPDPPAPAGGGSGHWPGVRHDELAALNARLGLLASLAGFAAGLPAVAVLKLFGAPWVLRLDVVVFAVGTLTALRLPVRRPVVAGGTVAPGATSQPPATGVRGWDAPVAPSAPGREPVTGRWHGGGPAGALGLGPTLHPEVSLALTAMSILKGTVGFLTFLLAFDLRRRGVATWWFGLVLVASIGGSLSGVLLVPRARRLLDEQRMLAGSGWLVTTAGVAAAVVGHLVLQAVLAYAVGLAGAAAKPAFDALVQRYVPPAAQGRAFARFETQLQISWVLGALVPVVIAIPFTAGDIAIAAVCGVAGFSYLTGRRALRHRWAPGG